jgi:hypothetical protein
VFHTTSIIYNSRPVGTVLHAAVQKGRDAKSNSVQAGDLSLYYHDHGGPSWPAILRGIYPRLEELGNGIWASYTALANILDMKGLPTSDRRLL